MRIFCELCEEIKEIESDDNLVCWKTVCDPCYTEIERYMEKMRDIRIRWKKKK